MDFTRRDGRKALISGEKGFAVGSSGGRGSMNGRQAKKKKTQPFSDY